jgi:tether containing UBX domain for GLUT4
MSAHVVVIDSTARRAVVKTTPSKPLTDVLQEASIKLGFDPNHHGLKYTQLPPPAAKVEDANHVCRHQSKTLDLSLSIRLAGLSSGSKLELVQLSRSPAVVTVALQLPEAEAHGVPNGRLLDKFPSSTTLWLMLRKFESGVAGGTTIRNLTARGAPATDSGDSGAGRLYYQTPVIQLMGRELSSFTDLQKSLAQLGFNGGNVLLRLNFRTTQEPLEEAMVKIIDYFKPLDEQGAVESTGNTATETVPPTSVTAPTTGSIFEDLHLASTRTDQLDSTTIISTTSENPPSIPTAGTALPSVVSRPVTIYRPPATTTPQSTQALFREEDYVPSIEHAKSHQDRLNQQSRNARLLSDAEITAKAAAKEERLSLIKEVDVKIRFPEQSQILAKFNQTDSGTTLYSFARDCLDESLVYEKFNLTLPGIVPRSGGGLGGGSGRNHSSMHSSLSSTTTTTTASPKTAILDSPDVLLIRDLGFRGRVLVNFSWDDSASVTARGSTNANLLKSALRSQAQDIAVPVVPPFDVDDDKRTGDSPSSPFGKLGAALRRGNEAGSGKKQTGGPPKWFKLPGKK